MIKLELNAGYCHDCPNFEADVEKPSLVPAGDYPYALYDHTYVRCAHRKVCGSIADHVEKAIRKEYDHD